MRLFIVIRCAVIFVLCFAKAVAQTAPPAMASILESDIKRDVYALADDRFRGREAGTLDELKVAVWWADELRKAGLSPAGDDGTYFQYFELLRSRVSSTSTIKIGSENLVIWKDALVAFTAPAELSSSVVFAGKADNATLDGLDLKGKVVAVEVSPDSINLDVSLPERRYPSYVYRKYGANLVNRGAIGIIFIADEMAEKSWPAVLPALTRGTYNIEPARNTNLANRVPVIWVHAGTTEKLRANPAIQIRILVEKFTYPSVNVIAKVDGTDPVLKKEFLLYSGHNDHEGIRMPYGNDSIYNGADDNASVSGAMMAISRAFKKAPAKRSVLFVYHGAEERGLLGSRYFAANPTVDKSAIVAVLNGDMIGANNIDSAVLMGVQPPHLNSPDLVKMALDANREGDSFKLDTLWDKPSHIEGWYFRSDHLPHARAGFPAVFYSSMLHPIYHTPMDEAKTLNYKKIKKMADWMYRTGWKVANAPKRPAVLRDFKLER
ncbi:MAG: M28 family peptidase [Sphingobacteriales bacterium]|nr:MAG: M28 family peptidase [Sphingobacteriales bacterium]